MTKIWWKSQNVAIFVSLCITVSVSHATPLDAQQKANLVRGVTQSCFTTQRQNPINNVVADSEVVEYCSCYANRAADLLSVEIMQQIIAAKDPKLLRPYTESAGEYCGQLFAKKWGLIE